MSVPDRHAMLDKGHVVLSVRRQCTLLNLARSGVFMFRADGRDYGRG
jgi:hypothetical protein